jgi:tRNA A37 threonylcarbamoyltransferase TsaD
LITGGHTEIIYTQGVGMHTIFGKTQDIAVGDALDRFASKVSNKL